MAEISLQANWYGTELASQRVGADGQCFSYGRHWLGIDTLIRDGVIVAPDMVEPMAVGEQLVAPQTFDVATFRMASAWSLQDHGSISKRLGNYDVTIRRGFLQEVLNLPATTQSLASLSRNVRRNIVRARQRAGEQRIECIWQPASIGLDRTALAELCRHNMPTTIRPRRLSRVIHFTQQQPVSFFAVARTRDHRLVSVVGGYIEDRLAFMTFQANSAVFADVGPSLLMRAFIAERLHEAGVEQLCFVGRCAGTLLNVCQKEPMFEILLVRRSLPGRLKHRACVMAQPRSRIARLSLIRPAMAGPTDADA